MWLSLELGEWGQGLLEPQTGGVRLRGQVYWVVGYCSGPFVVSGWMTFVLLWCKQVSVLCISVRKCRPVDATYLLSFASQYMWLRAMDTHCSVYNIWGLVVVVLCKAWRSMVLCEKYGVKCENSCMYAYMYIYGCVHWHIHTLFAADSVSVCVWEYPEGLWRWAVK